VVPLELRLELDRYRADNSTSPARFFGVSLQFSNPGGSEAAGLKNLALTDFNSHSNERRPLDHAAGKTGHADNAIA